MKDLQEGDVVILEKPYRGYREGTIIDVEFPCYRVQFDGGMTEKFYCDEFKEVTHA